MRFFTLCIWILYSNAASANPLCLDLFKTQNGAAAPSSHSSISVPLSFPTGDFGFYPQMKISREFYTYLIGSPHEGFARALSQAMRFVVVTSDSASIFLFHPKLYSKKDASVGTDIYWNIDPSAPGFARSYATIREIQTVYKKASEEDKSELELTEAEAQLAALLISKLVPASPPRTVQFSLDHYITASTHRVKRLLHIRDYRAAYAMFLKNAVPKAFLTLRLELPPDIRDLLVSDRIAQLAKKLESTRSLSPRDFHDSALVADVLLQLVSQKQDVNPERGVRVEISQSKFHEDLMGTLFNHVPYGTEFYQLVSFFENIFFAAPLPLANGEFVTQVVEAGKALILPLKNEYTRIQAEAHQHQLLQALTNVTPQAPPSASPSLPQTTISQPRDHVKTRGQPAVVAVQTPAPTAATVRNESSLMQFIEARNVDSLEVAKHYMVEFQRQHTTPHHRQHAFEFSAEAVSWMQSNPQLAQKFLSAIWMGPTNLDHGQAGIKSVRQHHPDGKLFEVKISDGFRMVVLFSNDVWLVTDVVTKKEFDRYIRSL